MSESSDPVTDVDDGCQDAAPDHWAPVPNGGVGFGAVPGASRAGDVLALLLLADGRFPAGSHVHSAGVESAVADGRVTGDRSLRSYLAGRLHTVAATDAALAAATVVRLRGGDTPGGSLHVALAPVLELLDDEAAARLAVPALRDASRRMGRQLLRVARRCWPGPLLELAAVVRPEGLHQAVALGTVGAAVGCTPAEVAALACHHALNTPAQAAVRLLGLDPFSSVAAVAALGPEVDAVVAEAVRTAQGPLADLPSRAGPRCEIAAAHHHRMDPRLFAT